MYVICPLAPDLPPPPPPHSAVPATVTLPITLKQANFSNLHAVHLWLCLRDGQSGKSGSLAWLSWLSVRSTGTPLVPFKQKPSVPLSFALELNPHYKPSIAYLGHTCFALWQCFDWWLLTPPRNERNVMIFILTCHSSTEKACTDSIEDDEDAVRNCRYVMYLEGSQLLE